MAPTNKQRIDEALELLRDALAPVVERVLGPHAEGLGWPTIIEELDRAKGRYVREEGYSADDLHTLLRATTERVGGLGFPFGFSRAVSNYLNEAAVLRNDFAHMQQFGSDDTLRALDTVSRLLNELGDPEGARTLAKSRADLNRRVYAEQARQDARSAFNDLGDDDLLPWHEVLEPHPDVVSGRFKESEFAANLYSVAHGLGDTGPEYRDPIEFFRRTYLTEGLSDLLTQSACRISGAGSGAPVINLQTTFGGGKTHSMLAVWHLLGGVDPDSLPDEVGDIIRDSGIANVPVARAAIVGNEIPPGQARSMDDGTVIRTLWGEIAWQLGGREGYAMVQDADRTGTNPGSALRDVFAAYSPCVVLVDEWVAYARQLHGRDNLVGGTFETQFSFAQALTEAAAQTPGALVLVSIPASDVRSADGDMPVNDLETGGEHGRAALGRLEHVVGRTAHQWQPASSVESFEIVRRRLFSEPDDTASRRISATARKFVEYYRKNHGDLPSHVREGAYEERIRRAFPIHPELFDRLYEDWSTLERFQRTRGVLRLMSTVVKTLLDSGDRAPIIMPGSVPVGSAAVTSEFMQYVDTAWRVVIDTDVEGENSNAALVDSERSLLGNRHTTVRLARALFIASAATHSSAHKGVSAQDLFLGVAMPGDVIGNFHSALNLLEDRSTYVFHDAARHWLDVSPSLNRTARDRANSLEESVVESALIDWLRRACDDPGRLFQHIVVDPVDGADVAEHTDARLVVLGPRHAHRQRQESPATEAAREIATRRGQAGRKYRNSLVFLAPDEGRVETLRSAVRDHLAWKSIVDDTEKLDLRHEQASTARRRMEEEAGRIENQVPSTWIWTISPHQKDGGSPVIDVKPSKVDNAETRLAVRAAKKFTDADELRSEVYAPALIRVTLDRFLFSIWNQGHITVEQLWDFHASYLYLPRLRDIGVLLRGVETVLSEITGAETFWLATGYDPETGTYLGLLEPLVDADAGFHAEFSTLLVRPEIARLQREREAEIRDDTSGSAPFNPRTPGVPATPASASAVVSERGRGRAPVSGAPGKVANVGYRARHFLDPAGDLHSELRSIAEEIVDNLLQGEPDVLDITVEVVAKKYAGFDDRTVRNVTENARTLDISESGFEDG